MSNVDLAITNQQLNALTPDVMRAYAAGGLSWSEIRERHDVVDFTLILRRLREEDLRLPRAPASRPTRAREWLREVLDPTAAR